MSFDMDLETTMSEEIGPQATEEKPATLLWLDFETTGFDEEECQPIQIGVIVTDNDLREIASGEWVINEWPDLHWEEGARRMHEATGLAASIDSDGLPLDLVDMAIGGMIDAHFPDGAKPMMAGNSIHFDRRFLARWFPSIDQRLHHRHYDVSSAFEVVRRTLGVTPRWSQPKEKGRPHTALADLRETIADLKLLRDDFAALKQAAAHARTLQANNEKLRAALQAAKPDALGMSIGTFEVVGTSSSYIRGAGPRHNVEMYREGGAVLSIEGVPEAWAGQDLCGKMLRVSLATVEE
jgi:oligoribonuclease